MTVILHSRKKKHYKLLNTDRGHSTMLRHFIDVVLYNSENLPSIQNYYVSSIATFMAQKSLILKDIKIKREFEI